MHKQGAHQGAHVAKTAADATLLLRVRGAALLGKDGLWDVTVNQVQWE